MISRLENELDRARKGQEVEHSRKEVMALKKELAEKTKKIEQLDSTIVKFNKRMTDYETAIEGMTDKDKETSITLDLKVRDL